MTEPNGNDTTTAKKSVVDDFFSALFANNTAASSSISANKSEVYEPTSTNNQEYNSESQDYKYNYSADVNNNSNNKNNNIDNDEQDDNTICTEEEESQVSGGRKRERVLDEFDEYSLLSKRRGSDNRNKNNFNNRRKPIEAREIIQDVNQNNETDSIKLDRQILSKRDIDWSTVKPESRMLVRQLPKFIDKQDVMNYFSKYGEVLEVVQKTPFGFVHFENPEACAQAVQIENGKPFHGIVLDLEICKRKPFFARAAEREMRELANRENNNNNEDRNISPVGSRRNSHQRNFESRSRGNVRQDQYDPYDNNRNASSPPSRYQQQPPPAPRRGRNNDRNNDYRPDYGYSSGGAGNNNNNNSNNNNNNNGRNQDYNNRQQDNSRSYRPSPYPRYNDSNDGRNSYNPRYNDNTSSYNPRYTNDDSRSYNPRYNENLDGRNSYAPRYNDPVRPPSITRNYAPMNPVLPINSTVPLIPSRQGSDVPVVQIVAWDNVAYGFTDYIERVLSSNQIRASSITLPYSKNSRDEIVKQMILEGVKAIVMIDRDNEIQSKIYLQVFAPSEHGQGVRYDEYDSVTAIEAVSIIRRSYPAPVAQPTVPIAQPSQPAIDMNTLASIYNMIQVKPNTNVVSPPVNNQPTVPQLWATLVNALNVNSPQTMQSPQLTQSPQPTQPLQPTQPVQLQQPEQPNIAALISTAANGNPALAQLLAQLTTKSSTTLGYSPSMPHVEPTLGYPSTEQHQK